jgi:hypothetical protein
MPAKKKKLSKKRTSTVEEPIIPYAKRGIKIFYSHEQQEEYELKQMSLISPKEALQNLRKLINLAYGMHGFDPNKLPSKHSIKIIQKG